MNSCFKNWLLGLLVWAGLAIPRHSYALSVHAVYRTACSRDVGIILRVEKRDIMLLRLDGKLIRIPRHEIVSLLYYPVSKLPLSGPPNPQGFPPLQINTQYRGEVVELLTGWPIDYSENQISFLLPSGKELVVDRESIWSLATQHTAHETALATKAEAVEFMHPQTSGFCSDSANAIHPELSATPESATENSIKSSASMNSVGPRQIFAHQILNDQIVIRRELDRLREGYEQVLEYEQDQKFYPTPFVYRNRTMLGLWVSLLSRYGASSTRSNNFTPVLADELALGPFRYQHLFLSGAAPNENFLHQEAQSQIFYRFKAAYFHTSVFFDPNLLLVGTKYNWRDDDVKGESLDDRISETLAIEFGFDWGPFSIELYPAVLGQSLVKINDFTDTTTTHNLWRVGMQLRFASWRIHGYAGLAQTDVDYDRRIEGEDFNTIYVTANWRYSYGRVDLTSQRIRGLDAGISFVARQLTYEGRSPGTEGENAVNEDYESTSLSTALQASYALSHRFSVGGHAILEMQKRSDTENDERSRVLPRFGVFTGFWF